MKKIWFALLSLLLTASLGAQQQAVSTLRGTVVDAKSNQPLVGATVIVDSTYSAMADGRGVFAVSRIPRGEAQVLILFTGYETHKTTVAFDRPTVDLGTVRLEEEAKELDEVVAVGTAAAIVQKGDTTQYNAAAYKTNPDADAADLLAKMPGMEVEGGVVKAQGDTVKRVYVNNELFLGNDAMQVLATLPADLVESMQMFDEQPDDMRFSGYDDGRTQRALNVVTRGGRINRQIEATIPLAYGFETAKELDGSRAGLYNFSPNLLVISPKYNFNINGTLSNIGGGMGSGRRMGGGRMGGGGFTTNKNINLNVGRTWDRDNSLNLNYSFGQSDNENRTITHSDFLPTDYFDSRTTLDTTRSESTSRNHNAGLTARFTKGRNMLNLRSSVSFSDGDSWNGNIDHEERNGALWSLLNRQTTGTSNSYSINNQLDWVVRLGQKAGRTLNVSASMQLSNNESVSIQRGEMIELDRNSTDYITSPENYTTTNTGPGKSFRGGISYNEPLAERLRLNLNYGISYNSGEQERKRINDDTGLIEENTSTISVTERLRHSGRVGLTFSLPNKLTATTGIELISMRDERDYTLPTDTLRLQQYAIMQPSAMFNYRFTPQRTLRLTYSGMPGVPSLDNLSNVVNDANPNRLRAGNPNLKRSYTHTFNLRYNNTNPTTYNNFNLSVQGSMARNTSVNKTIYYTEDTFLPEYDYTAPAGSELQMPVNANGTVNLRAGAGYSFRLLNQRISLDGTYNFNQRPSYIGDQLNKARTNEAGFRLGVNSNIENIDFSINSRTSYRRTTYSQDQERNTETFTQSLSANVNVLFLQQRVVFNTNYSMNYSNQNISTTNDLRAYVGYRFLKRRTAEFRVEINDVFNQTPDFTFREGTDSETRTWSLVRGRYVMARFQYRFNSLQSLANRVGRNASGEGTPGEGAPDERFDRERMRQMRESGEMPEGVRVRMGEGGGGMRMGGGFGGGF